VVEGDVVGEEVIVEVTVVVGDVVGEEVAVKVPVEVGVVIAHSWNDPSL
jgi:hypothetical protein